MQATECLKPLYKKKTNTYLIFVGINTGGETQKLSRHFFGTRNWMNKTAESRFERLSRLDRA